MCCEDSAPSPQRATLSVIIRAYGFSLHLFFLRNISHDTLFPWPESLSWLIVVGKEQ
jgi:hypothetical protein